MRIAVLFNSDHPKYRGFYGRPIRDTILSTGVIQRSGRHVKVKIGDVLIYSHSKTRLDLKHIGEATFFSHPWQLFISNKLRSTYQESTIYAWVIQNIDEETARTLHESLSSNDAYLGMHAVDLTNPAHLVLYRNSLIGRYRIQGSVCS